MEYSSDSSSDEDLELACIWYINTFAMAKSRKRRWWVHDILKQRQKRGEYHLLVAELQLDGDRFKQYFRMSREQFRELLFLVEGHISKTNTQLRDAISPRERLAITLRFLATGNSYKSLGFSYRIAACTVGKIVPEVCTVLWERLKGTYLKMPSDENDWNVIAKNFELQWNLPHCLGAIDGKHIVMKAPNNSGSLYYNYKHTFSTILMAVADANYRFIYIDIGSYGRNSDGGVFSHSNFGKALKREKLPLPNPEPLPNDTELGSIPFYFVGDEAFPLLVNLMRPYPGGKKGLSEGKGVFNYRLSRGRRVIENTFGILAARWRVFHTAIAVNPDTTKKIVQATTVLHNFLQTTSTPPQIASICAEADEMRNTELFTPLRKFGTRGSTEAEVTREKLQHYFLNKGEVSWQLNHVRRGKFE